MDYLSKLNDCKYINFRNFAIATAIVAVIVFAASIYLKEWGPYIDNFFPTYKNMFVEGKIPYSDFPFEYPPFTLVFAIIPGLLSFNDVNVYGSLFTILTALFYALTVYYLIKITERYDVSDKLIIVLALATLILLAPTVLLRNDVFAVFFIVSALYYYLEKRYDLAFILISLGVMTKLFPLIIAFAFIIPFILNKEYLKIVRYALVSAAVCLIISLPFLIIDSGTAFSYLTYHSDRGLHLECFASAFVLLVNLFTPVCEQVFNYGSINIVGAMPDAIAKVLTPLMAVVFVALLVLCIYKTKSIRPRCDFRFVLVMALISIFVFLMCNKVLSTQFMIWFMLPLSLFLAMNPGHRYHDRILLFSVATVLVTSIMFASGVMSNTDAPATLLLLLRDVVLFMTFFYIFKLFWEEYVAAPAES